MKNVEKLTKDDLKRWIDLDSTSFAKNIGKIMDYAISEKGSVTLEDVLSFKLRCILDYIETKDFSSDDKLAERIVSFYIAGKDLWVFKCLTENNMQKLSAKLKEKVINALEIAAYQSELDDYVIDVYFNLMAMNEPEMTSLANRLIDGVLIPYDHFVSRDTKLETKEDIDNFVNLVRKVKWQYSEYVVEYLYGLHRGKEKITSYYDLKAISLECVEKSKFRKLRYFSDFWDYSWRINVARVLLSKPEVAEDDKFKELLSDIDNLVCCAPWEKENILEFEKLFSYLLDNFHQKRFLTRASAYGLVNTAFRDDNVFMKEEKILAKTLLQKMCKEKIYAGNGCMIMLYAMRFDWDEDMQTYLEYVMIAYSEQLGKDILNGFEKMEIRQHKVKRKYAKMLILKILDATNPGYYDEDFAEKMVATVSFYKLKKEISSHPNYQKLLEYLTEKVNREKRTKNLKRKAVRGYESLVQKN